MKHAHPTEVKAWTEPPQPEEQPEPGYDAWLAEEIERGRADIAAGRVFPIEDVKKELGLE